MSEKVMLIMGYYNISLYSPMHQTDYLNFHQIMFAQIRYLQTIPSSQGHSAGNFYVVINNKFVSKLLIKLNRSLLTWVESLLDFHKGFCLFIWVSAFPSLLEWWNIVEIIYIWLYSSLVKVLFICLRFRTFWKQLCMVPSINHYLFPTLFSSPITWYFSGIILGGGGANTRFVWIVFLQLRNNGNNCSVKAAVRWYSSPYY